MTESGGTDPNNNWREKTGERQNGAANVPKQPDGTQSTVRGKKQQFKAGK